MSFNTYKASRNIKRDQHNHHIANRSNTSARILLTIYSQTSTLSKLIPPESFVQNSMSLNYKNLKIDMSFPISRNIA